MTVEYDLLDGSGSWELWAGSIGQAVVSISCNECSGDEGCNLNGVCTKEGTCECSTAEGVEFLGTHCEVKVKDQCRTISPEGLDDVKYSVLEDSSGTVEMYSRPGERVSSLLFPPQKNTTISKQSCFRSLPI